MEIIITSLTKVLLNVGPFFILLGILIFVHELGHFLTAIYFGVRVEVFSLGFGKKVYQYKRGDTNYCLSLIPLGGYVKMFGDDPSKEIPEDQKKFSFLHQPLIPRMLIVLAGPLVNLLFAVLIFAAVAMVGENLPSPVVGDIPHNTTASRSGFMAGDTISKINGHEIVSWIDVSRLIKSHPEKPLNIEVKRGQEIFQLKATPEWGDNDNLISLDERVGVIEGLSLKSEAALVGISRTDSLAYKNKMATVSYIEEINGRKVSYFRDLPNVLRELSGQNLSIKYLNYLDPTAKSIELTIKSWEVSPDDSPEQILNKIGFDKTDLYLMAVKKSSPASAAGLKPGDKVVALNQLPVKSWTDILTTVKAYRLGDPAIDFKIIREGQNMQVSIIPEMTNVMNELQEENRYTVGISPALAYVGGGSIFIRTLNPFAALWQGVTRSAKWTGLTIMSFVRLIQNKVSPKNISGVISIGRVASESFAIGLSAFLKVMAIISINLFILNLLPIPVLDGGHLMFFILEAFKGAPISLKKMEIAQTVGIVLLMSLMIFALFNDVSNLYTSWAW